MVMTNVLLMTLLILRNLLDFQNSSQKIANLNMKDQYSQGTLWMNKKKDGKKQIIVKNK